MHALVGSVAGAKHEWSYEGECGPQTWQKSFVGARGRHQSPINIETQLAVYDPSLAAKPLVIDYDHHSCSQIKNTGFTFQVDSHPTNLSSMHLRITWYRISEAKLKYDCIKAVSGGPVNHQYNFLQFHMHWGDNLERGSEHLLDNKAYSAEVR